MRRRQFITLLGGAVAWPLVARAQQAAMPMVGFVTGLSSNYVVGRKPAFRQGLREVGYVEGQNVVVESHSVEGQSGRLPGVVTDLIDRKVAVIVAVGGTDPAKAAKAATTTIPIVFISAADPLGAGIVTRLNRPEGNITGISILGTSLEAKRLGLLHDIVPGTSVIGVLVNPGFSDADFELREVEEAASLVKRQIHVVRASKESEFDDAFAIRTIVCGVSVCLWGSPRMTRSGRTTSRLSGNASRILAGPMDANCLSSSGCGDGSR